MGLSLPTITAAHIANPSGIAEHAVLHGNGTRVHLYRFLGGGELRIECDLQGAVVALHGNQLLLSANANGVVVVRTAS